MVGCMIKGKDNLIVHMADIYLPLGQITSVPNERLMHARTHTHTHTQSHAITRT